MHTTYGVIQGHILMPLCIKKYEYNFYTVKTQYTISLPMKIAFVSINFHFFWQNTSKYLPWYVCTHVYVYVSYKCMYHICACIIYMHVLNIVTIYCKCGSYQLEETFRINSFIVIFLFLSSAL